MSRIRSWLALLAPWRPGGVRWRHYSGLLNVVFAIALLSIGFGAGAVFEHHHDVSGGLKPSTPPPISIISGGANPIAWNLTKDLVRIHNQGNTNTCPAQTVATIEEIVSRERRKAKKFSAYYVYSQVNGGVDNGTSYDAVFGILNTQGDAPLKYWPDTNLFTHPDAAARTAARPYEFGVYRSIATTDQYTMEWAISHGIPIAVALPINDSFYDNWNDSTLPVISSQYGTYHFDHSVTGVGYTSQGLIVVNSWGRSWGHNGEALLTWSFIAQVSTIIVYAQPGTPIVPPKAFPVRRWNSYTSSHHLKKEPHGGNGHLTRAAWIWFHDRGVSVTWGVPKHRGTYLAKYHVERIRFTRGTVYVWPAAKGQPVKFVKGT